MSCLFILFNYNLLHKYMIKSSGWNDDLCVTIFNYVSHHLYIYTTIILKPTTRRQPKVREDVRWVILIWNLFEINYN